jgi:hypothetical protein
LGLDDFGLGRPYKSLEIVQTWHGGKFEEIDLAKWVPSSPRYPLSNNFAGVPETTITILKQASTTWDYTAFGETAGGSAGPDEDVQSQVREGARQARVAYNRWTINGKSWPETNPLFTVTEGKRYRLVMNNNSGGEHPVHIHRHSFEITKVGDKSTSGVIKDTLSLPRYSAAEVDFVADDSLKLFVARFMEVFPSFWNYPAGAVEQSGPRKDASPRLRCRSKCKEAHVSFDAHSVAVLLY